MLLYAIHNIPVLRKWFFNSAGIPFTEKKIRFFLPYLQSGSTVLDIGSGSGLITSLLRKKNFDVTPLDIIKGNFHQDTEPILYDGIHMPFSEKKFDYGLLLTVLHHVKDNEALLVESARVCRRIIIIEDVYDNRLQKSATLFADTVVNLLYAPCPHTNHSHKEWQNIFQRHNLTMEHTEFRKILGIFKQVMYVLKCQ